MNEKEKKGIAYSMDFVNFVYKIGVYDQKIKHRGDGDMYLSRVMEDYKNQSQTVRVDDEDIIQYGQNLFNQLQDTCDFVALEDDMNQIIKAVIKDNPKLTTLVSELQDKLARQNEVIEELRMELDKPCDHCAC